MHLNTFGILHVKTRRKNLETLLGYVLVYCFLSSLLVSLHYPFLPPSLPSVLFSLLIDIAQIKENTWPMMREIVQTHVSSGVDHIYMQIHIQESIFFSFSLSLSLSLSFPLPFSFLLIRPNYYYYFLFL